MVSTQHQEEIDSLHPLEKKILIALSTESTKSFEQLGEDTALEEGQLRRALGWLLTKEFILIDAENMTSSFVLTEKGQFFAQNGTPEVKIIQELEAGKDLHMKDVKSLPGYDPDDVTKAVGALKKVGALNIENGYLKIDDHEALLPFKEISEFIAQYKDGVRSSFDDLKPEHRDLVAQGFRKRGKSKGTFIIEEKVDRHYRLTETGLQIRDLLKSLNIPIEEISQMTPQHLKDGSWRGKSFRKYNITIPPPHILVGRKHPYREFLDQLKVKLISMGFEEMRGNIVENEFWNMDALFMPQFHSARDIHDIYFVQEPDLSKTIEEPFYSNVSRCHEDGGDTGSSGWLYHFSREMARKQILRSQGTVLSARTLSSQPNIPGKYFAIARCFRYDSIDATHAPDFYQVEGIVLGNDINFRHLLGLLKLFAEEVARAQEVKYVPAYFPFTEPSVEVHIKHETLGWMEMGGAGLFRPEVTIPLGVDVPVIAWGLGVDRMAMVALGIEDIRDLFSTDLDLIRSKVFNL